MNINLEKIDTILEKFEKMEISIVYQNTMLNELNNNIEELIAQRPEFIPLVTIASEIKKSRQTLRYYITTHYEPEVDFISENGKILISSRVVPRIKEHYEK